MTLVQAESKLREAGFSAPEKVSDNPEGLFATSQINNYEPKFYNFYRIDIEALMFSKDKIHLSSIKGFIARTDP